LDGHSLENLTRVLQASISPVALVSGVGLLILSQTNRLGRVTDRVRDLARQQRTLNSADGTLERQITVLRRRALALKRTITASVISVLLASVLVLLLFTAAVMGLNMDRVIIALFAASIVALITSLLFFLYDTHLALRALDDEVLR
jgi:hypothetical protein